MAEATRRDFPQKVANNVQAWLQEVNHRVKDYRNQVSRQKTVKNALETGKSFFENQYRQRRHDLENAAEKGRSMQNEARHRIDHWLENGKEWLELDRFRQDLEKRINETLDAIPRVMNLPERREVEKLSKSVKALSRRVDALARTMKR